MTRRRPAVCQRCEKRPVRRIRNARYCSPCVSVLPKKTCAVCGDQFHPDRMNGPRCKPCASNVAHGKRIEDTYGITSDQYAELLAFQGGACYICRRKPASKRLAVDHSHQTGETRGLLCRTCNREVLGHLRDDTEALQRAIDYLTDTPARQLWGDEVPIAPDVS